MDTEHSVKFKANAVYLAQYIAKKKDEISKLPIDAKKKDMIISKIDKGNSVVAKSRGCQLISTFAGKTVDKWVSSAGMSDAEARSKIEFFSPSQDLTEVIELLIEHEVFPESDIASIIKLLRRSVGFSISHYVELLDKQEGDEYLKTEDNKYCESVEDISRDYFKALELQGQSNS